MTEFRRQWEGRIYQLWCWLDDVPSEGQGEVMSRSLTWAIDTIHRDCPVVGGAGRRREDLAATERWLEELVKFPSSPVAMTGRQPHKSVESALMCKPGWLLKPLEWRKKQHRRGRAGRIPLRSSGMLCLHCYSLQRALYFPILTLTLL